MSRRSIAALFEDKLSWLATQYVLADERTFGIAAYEMWLL